MRTADADPVDSWPAVDVGAAMRSRTPEQLRAAGSIKWTAIEPGEIGAFIAEMDFPLAPAIIDAVQHALDDGRTGYLSPSLDREVREACAQFQLHRHRWSVDPEVIRLAPDVLTAVRLIAGRVATDGGVLVIPTPAYMPFLELPGMLGIPHVRLPMHQSGGRWLIDLDALDDALVDGGVLILVNPHNPTGTVATAAEHDAVTTVVERRGALVLADEIHSPLVYPGATHVPYASVSPAAAEHTLTAVSASKGWNLPGLPCAQLIATGSRSAAMLQAIPELALHGATPFGALATIAAYRHGSDHLDAVLQYLIAGNSRFAATLASTAPGIGYSSPQAGYLHWLDLRPIGVDPGAVRTLTGVVGTDGTLCGTAGFLRLTLGTSHAVIDEVAARLSGLTPQ